MASSVLRYGLSTVAYWEPRFITPFIQHIPDWVEDVTVLSSTRPWMGKHKEGDPTASLARAAGARVIENYWATEAEQRNTGCDLHMDKDWVIIMDPDEFLDDEGWEKLKEHLENTDSDAVVVEGQNTYWKNGYVADPARDYQMLIAVRPHVKFVDKRIVGIGYGTAPVWMHHFSWARTDEEIWSKISHYAHAEDFNIKDWYENVWLKWEPGVQDVHPVTPETLHDLIPTILPPELERLSLWP